MSTLRRRQIVCVALLIVGLFVVLIQTRSAAGYRTPALRASTLTRKHHHPNWSSFWGLGWHVPRRPNKPLMKAPVATSVATPKVRGPAAVKKVTPVSLSGVPALIAKYWPGDDQKVLCVVAKETGRTYNPMIKSRTGKYWGLFQADASFRASYGWAGWGVKEQTAMAWRGFQARGWSPWPTAYGC